MMKRADIQGLRMVAVVAVVAFHLTGYPTGGFVGVDVFFVISGFLMTGILMRELGRSHSAAGYLGSFYLRRARRLLPAALIVTAMTLLVARVVFNSARYDTTLTDGLWATAFSANWHFISTGTDYFAAGQPTSPFEHYWSLSVEEQFYFGLPVVLLVIAGGAVALTRATGARAASVRAGATLLVSAAAVVLSLWWAAAQSTSDPVTAYFSTFTRIWELALGGVVAVLIRYVNLATRWLTLMSWAGLAVITVSLFTVTTSGFPYPGAILPCLGSALVLAAASSSGQARNWVLTNKASVFVGDISYSVYLVHMPVIIFLTSFMGFESRYYYVAAVLMTFGLSCALWGLVERPIANSSRLQPRGHRPVGAIDGQVRTRTLAVVALVCMAGSVFSVALVPGNDVTPVEAAAPGSSEPLPPKAAALSEQVADAVVATEWPKLVPTIEDVLAAPHIPLDTAGCGTMDLAPADECTWGDASAEQTVYLVGDSTSVSYVAAFREMVAQEDGWKVRSAGGLACQFVDPSYLAGNLNQDPLCRDHNAAVVADIKSTNPDLVVITNYESNDRIINAMREQIQLIAPHVPHVVVLTPPPPGKDPSVCYTPLSTPGDCVSDGTSDWVGGFAALRSMVLSEGATFVDSTPWFCRDGYCPVFVGQLPAKLDEVHATTDYLRHIAPVILEAFYDQGLLKPDQAAEAAQG